MFIIMCTKTHSPIDPKESTTGFLLPQKPLDLIVVDAKIIKICIIRTKYL